MFLFILHTHILPKPLRQLIQFWHFELLSFISLLQLGLKQLVIEEIIQTFDLGPACQLGKTHITATSSYNFITREVKQN